MAKLKITYLPLEKLKPYEKNPRNNDDAVQYVKNSIEQFGFKNPIIIDSAGVIVAGHTRFKAAQELGLKEVPTIMADDLTPEQIKAFRIADNKTGEMAAWDIPLLKEELHDILDEFDMTEFGFRDYELDLNDEYIEDFFDRGVEAKEKPVILGVKVVCGSQVQVDEVKELLTEAGYNPEDL